MNPSAAGNINNAQFVQKAVRAPDPSRRKTIDNGVDQREKAVGIEIASEIAKRTM